MAVSCFGPLSSTPLTDLAVKCVGTCMGSVQFCKCMFYNILKNRTTEMS
jgi:hypothetical protein